MDELRSDTILSEILEERKSLTGFLDAIFGFLSRRTDFYHIQKNKDEQIGFPRGIKEEILLSCMQKYEKDNRPQELSHRTEEEYVPPAIEEVEIETEEIPPDVDTDANSQILKQSEKISNKTHFSENDFKNGDKNDKYCWTQTQKDVELSVLLPPEVKSAKHVKIIMKSNHISIKSLLPQEQELVSGETWCKFKHNDAVWTIVDGKLVLSFDKTKERWWDKLFVHDASIDIKKLDTEMPIDEYPEETQQQIDKIQTQLINQNLDDVKNTPLSKSEQLSRLKQAWNAENSPFKGQPFDPSLIQFD
ncbi:nudC domain-containing protein 3 [Musca vetustissima]|uniref:nudC domain-containing protein 3 n=1 Tax=Musca vetustissima TaxID=27455 RepID=UPI002AB6023B|nr:nudC domain-containing protein 3 [Musca vetustissima]